MNTFSESPALRTDLPLEFLLHWSASGNLPHDQHPYDSFLWSSSLQNMSCNTPPNYRLSIQLHLIVFEHGTPHTEVVHALQASIFSTLEARGTHLFGSSRHFVRNDQNKLCAHDKNRKQAELWVTISLFNVFVMHALDSAHVKVQRLKQRRSFAVVFDKPGQIERQVDPNTIFPNLIDSNVELYMCRI